MKTSISTRIMSSTANQDLYIRHTVQGDALVIEIIDSSFEIDSNSSIILTQEEVKTLISALEFMLDK